MTEAFPPRKITANCDFCENNESECSLIILADKSIMVLCDTHLELLKKFCERIDQKWSEITL